MKHETTNIKENNDIRLDFWATLTYFSWFLTFILDLLTWFHENLLSSVIIRLMNWDQNWVGPECSVHSTVFVENPALLEIARIHMSHTQIIHQNRMIWLVKNVQSFVILNGNYLQWLKKLSVRYGNFW